MKFSQTILLPVVLVFSSCGVEVRNSISEGHEKDYYNEPFRPQFHFSPDSMWMNDPNGMVYFEGEYHLFYQYYPDSTVWGPMHWGHAVSSDLVYWEHLPIALYPDELGLIFSGSAVIDYDNTSGLGSSESPAMVAIYTYHLMEGENSGSDTFQYQGIAYSLDNGRSWTKYEGNPVLENPGIRDFRDPKVIWYEEEKKWVMVLAVQDHVSFYSSKNLIDWVFESDFGKDYGAHGGVWECPDLFLMKDEDTGVERWVLLVSINPGGPNGGSATQYFTGDFDGKDFVMDQRPDSIQWLDYGTDNYAGVTWSNVPDSDGRRLFIGWMSNWQYAQVVPTERWRSAMTVPRELNLSQIDNKWIVESLPVKELGGLRQDSIELSQFVIEGERDIVDNINGLSESMEFDLQIAELQKEMVIQFSNSLNEKLEVIIKKEEMIVDRTESGRSDFETSFARTISGPFNSENGVGLTIYKDASSIELFVNSGELVMTSLFFPNGAYNRLILKSEEQHIDSFKAYKLKSIWQN